MDNGHEDELNEFEDAMPPENEPDGAVKLLQMVVEQQETMINNLRDELGYKEEIILDQRGEILVLQRKLDDKVYVANKLEHLLKEYKVEKQSLRDTFACHVMSSLVSLGGGSVEHLSERAYKIADLMLEAREEKQDDE